MKAVSVQAMRTGVLASVAALVCAGCSANGSEDSADAEGPMVLATTTSTQNSGLLDELTPMFEEHTDCVAQTVAVGSGQAMTMGERGDADVLLVHSPDAEEQFMDDGHGSSREPVMHNDYVIVGPPDDPAGIEGSDDAAGAMTTIADSEASFTSRADDSGTHARELSLWEEAGTDPGGATYVETGQGMGETLQITSQQEGYTLADRGTFLATEQLTSEILVEGSEDLRNDYHVIVVDDEVTNEACAEAFSEWIRGTDAQEAIGDFGIEEHGEPLFFPDELD